MTKHYLLSLDGLSGIFSAKGLDNANHVELFREIRPGAQRDWNYGWQCSKLILRAVT